MPVIDVKNLSKSFRVPKKAPGLKASLKSLVHREWITKNAVADATFQVHSGEILGLIGANGAGKTTLVKMLSGIIHPSSGEAKVLGHTPWERTNVFRRQIALIMGQKAQLWWDLPAADCYLLLQQIYSIPASEFNDHLAYLVEALDVGKILHVPIRRLSLGERMKVELIATLLHKPKVVFLDEPTIGLDLNAQRALRQFLLEYRKSHSPAMILTSHYMEDIEKLCERVMIIREGSIVYDGSLKKIVSTYATARVISATLKDDEFTDEGELAQQKGLGRAQEISRSFPAHLGQLVEQEGARIKVRCQRDKVNETATYLLQKLKVEDLSISEDDIGTIIASLLAGRENVAR